MLRPLIVAISVLAVAGCQTGRDGFGRFAERYTTPATEYAVNRASEILIVYIGANDCPPCWTFKNHYRPDWISSPEYAHVVYRELEFGSVYDTSDSKVWPDDLKWLQSATYANSGAPRWIIVVDGKIISNQKSWTHETHPLIKQLVGRKLKS